MHFLDCFLLILPVVPKMITSQKRLRQICSQTRNGSPTGSSESPDKETLVRGITPLFREAKSTTSCLSPSRMPFPTSEKSQFTLPERPRGLPPPSALPRMSYIVKIEGVKGFLKFCKTLFLRFMSHLITGNNNHLFRSYLSRNMWARIRYQPLGSQSELANLGC